MNFIFIFIFFDQLGEKGEKKIISDLNVKTKQLQFEEGNKYEFDHHVTCDFRYVLSILNKC